MRQQNPAVRALAVTCPRCRMTGGAACLDGRGQRLPAGTAHAGRTAALLAVEKSRAQAAAAVIAAGLGSSPGPLLGGGCEALATAQGFSRHDARAGLEWAVKTRLVRRREGAGRARWHQLANSPQLAGEVPNHDRSGVHGA